MEKLKVVNSQKSTRTTKRQWNRSEQLPQPLDKEKMEGKPISKRLRVKNIWEYRFNTSNNGI